MIKNVTINEHVEYDPVTGEKTYIVKDGKPTGKRPRSDFYHPPSKRERRKIRRALEKWD